MVRVLIALRDTVARHRLQRSGHTILLIALCFGLLCAVGTFVLGFVRHQRSGAEGDVLAVVLLLWFAGQLAQAALTGGEETLRPEVFALLALPPRRLAWSLLVVGLLDPLLIVLALAYSALIPLGARGGTAALLTGIVATALTTVLTAILTTLVGGLLGPGAGRGRDLGTLLTALALSLLALTGTLLPAAISGLEDGHARLLTVVVRALPSGWGVNAVDSARNSHPVAAIAWLGALAGLTLLAAAVWPRVLRHRTGAANRGNRIRRAAQRKFRVLPAGPAGAVCDKELRLWVRDPVRLTCLLIAAVVGLGVAVVPRVTSGSGLLMPFGGPLTVVIAGACACNLYGNDGTSLWLTIMTPGSARADVLGRQAAWAILVLPFTVIETVTLTFASGQDRLWPWAIALLVAVTGGAAGLVPAASLLAVQPLDEGGNPTPGWSVKVHLAIYVIIATALPAAATLTVAALAGSTLLLWMAVPVAVLTGAKLARHGQGLAIRRLPAVQVDMLATLVASS